MDRIAYQTFAELEHDHFWFVSRRRIFFELLDRTFAAEPTRQRAVLEIEPVVPCFAQRLVQGQRPGR